MSGENKNGSLEVTKEDRMEGNSFEFRPGEPCVCPKYGALVPHQIETPCYKRSCPKCESKMLSM